MILYARLECLFK